MLNWTASERRGALIVVGLIIVVLGVLNVGSATVSCLGSQQFAYGFVSQNAREYSEGRAAPANEAQPPSTRQPQQPNSANNKLGSDANHLPARPICEGSARWLARAINDPVALFTLLLFVATWLLWGATQRALRDSRQHSERQLRAYLLIDGGNIFDGWPTSPFVQVGIPVARMNLGNSGQTPAYRVIHWSELKCLERSAEDTLTVPASLSGPFSIVGTKAPITQTSQLFRPLDQAEIDGLITGRHAIFVHGKIEYDDIFGTRRSTTYRLFYFGAWPPAPNAIFTFCFNGNEAN